MAGQVPLMRKLIALQVRHPSMPHSSLVLGCACCTWHAYVFLVDLHTAKAPLTTQRVDAST